VGQWVAKQPSLVKLLKPVFDVAVKRGL